MTLASRDRHARDRAVLPARIPSRLRSRIADELTIADSNAASSHEMAVRCLSFYIPGALMVLFAMILPNPGVVRLPLGLAIGLAVVVMGIIWQWGSRMSVGYYVFLVFLGSLLICWCGHFGGAGGLPITFLYVFCPIYSFYFFNSTLGVIQLGVVAAEVFFFPPPGGGPVFTLLILGTCAVAAVWTKSALDQIRKLARTDALTGLPNRRAWDDIFRVSLAVAERRREAICLVMVDLDHFKIFNDEQGHQAGDQLLQAMAKAWHDSLRAGDLVARYGGEEFVFLFHDCDLQSALLVVERLRLHIPRGQTCSAGVAEWDGKELSEVLLHRADAALFEAKRQGRNRTTIAPAPDAGDDTSAVGSASRWAGRVVEVLAQKRIDVAFQPVVDLMDRRITGYEALARPLGFEHRDSVEGFFVAASRMGKLSELDNLCRRSALETAGNFSHGMLLFVNISVTALVDPQFGALRMANLAMEMGHEPGDVVLEISERETVTNLDLLAKVVNSYRDAGFRFALDDVGDGHSTLEGLATVMPDFVKLAMNFTWNTEQRGPQAAVSSIVVFAKSTGAQVIAEGIEDEETARRLIGLGIGLGQGYHLGRPEPLPQQYRS
jgi:diguanylate cyclase (GGDEF)-like protein